MPERVKAQLVERSLIASPLADARVIERTHETGIGHHCIELVAQRAGPFGVGESFGENWLLRVVVCCMSARSFSSGAASRMSTRLFCLARYQRQFAACEIERLPCETGDVSESLAGVMTEQNQIAPFVICDAKGIERFR